MQLDDPVSAAVFFIDRLALCFIVLVDRHYLLLSIYQSFFLSYKRVTHKITQKSYLERILRYNRSLFIIEAVLLASKELSCSETKMFFEGDASVKEKVIEKIIAAKRVGTDLKPRLKSLLPEIQQTHLYGLDVEEKTKTMVDLSAEQHAKLLNLLWIRLEKNTAPAIPSSEWKKIGFQGNNPSTDFRGMGLFGLLQLVEMTKDNEEKALEIYSLSRTKEHDFPFCIVGINISCLIYKALKKNLLQAYLYETKKDLSLLYLKTFVNFSLDWMNTKNKNLLCLGIVMEKSWKKTKKQFQIKNTQAGR